MTLKESNNRISFHKIMIFHQTSKNWSVLCIKMNGSLSTLIKLTGNRKKKSLLKEQEMGEAQTNRMKTTLNWTFLLVLNIWTERNFIRIFGSLKDFADIFSQSLSCCSMLERHLLTNLSMDIMDWPTWFEVFIEEKILEELLDWWALTAISHLWKVTQKNKRSQIVWLTVFFQLKKHNSMST